MAGGQTDLLRVLPHRQQPLDIETVGVKVEDGAVDEIDGEVLAINVFEPDATLMNHFTELLIGGGVEDMS